MKIEKEFLIFNGFCVETELGPRAQCALGLLRLSHISEMLGPAHAAHGLPSVDRRLARAAHEPARPARAQRLLGALECIERATTVERVRRAASTMRSMASGYDMSHDKMFTVSTQGARRTYLTWSRPPTRSEEGERRRGGADRCTVAVLGGFGGRGSWPHLRELLRSGWVLRDLSRKKWGRLVRSSYGEPVAEIGAEAAAPLLVDSEVRGTYKMHWEGLLL
jgi:hypothetical protein